MYQYSKTYLLSFWISIIISFMLWFRNYNYDKMFFGFFLIICLSILFEYSILNGAENEITSKLYLCSFFLQPLILIFSVYSSSKTKKYKKISLILFFLFIFIFTYTLFYSLRNNIQSIIHKDGIILQSNGNNISTHYFWIYCIGIIIPFILILLENTQDFFPLLSLIYILFSISYTYFSSLKVFNCVFNTLLLGLLFILWMSGVPALQT